MSETAALLGRVVAGKFAIEEHVGGGAMGEVFRARHIVLDTAIALKIMRPDIAQDPMFRERFYREAKAASRLDHVNSVRVIDFGSEPDGLVYLAMEFLHGRTLLSVLRDEWPLPDERIVDLLVQTLAAVSVAHELGIVHRDLKPENIMVSVGPEDDGARPYHVKVCDFGIAKLNDPRGFQTDGAKPLTSSGTLIGTPEYMSPEQARGDALDARSDLYSIGIVLYQLLVGRVPFTAENALGVVLKQVTDEPVPPSQVRPGVNARLEAICLRALKKVRDDRYQSAKDMRRDLRGVFGYAPRAHSDESGAYLPTPPPTAAFAEAAPTMLAPVDGVDFTPKETSDGTELTVPGITPVGRYARPIVGIAAAALLVGAGVVVFFAKGGDGADERRAAASASAAAAASASASAAPTGAESSTEASPLTPALSVAKGGTLPPNPKPGSGKPVAPTASAASQAITTTAPARDAGAAAATAATVAADPTYNPSGAYVILGALTPQRVREDAVRAKMSAVLPKLSECYRSALMMAGAPVAGSAEIHMSIDENGNMTSIVNAPKHPQFARCAQGALAGQKVPVAAIESGGGGATASQWLTLHP